MPRIDAVVVVPENDHGFLRYLSEFLGARYSVGYRVSWKGGNPLDVPLFLVERFVSSIVNLRRLNDHDISAPYLADSATLDHDLIPG